MSRHGVTFGVPSKRIFPGLACLACLIFRNFNLFNMLISYIFSSIYICDIIKTHFLHQRQNTVNPFNDSYKLLIQAVIYEIRNRMSPWHRRLLFLIKLTSRQTWMSICGDTILIYQVWLAINHKNQSSQKSFSTSCAVIFSSLTDPTITLIFYWLFHCPTVLTNLHH
jgi:hypothetical protein